MENKSNIISFDGDFISKATKEIYENFNIKYFFMLQYYSNDFFLSGRVSNLNIFKDSYCLVYIFDLSNIDTLYKLPDMINNYIYTYSIRQFSENIPIFIIGNKSDIKKEINISKDEMEKLCSPFKFEEYIEISAKNSIGVKEAFEKIEKKTLEYYHYYQDLHQECY